MCVLQPGRELFTNHTKKNNNKSCVVHLPVSLRPQHGSQTETNGADWQAASFSSVNPACVPVSWGVSLHANEQEVWADAFVSWLRVGSEPTSVPRPEAEPALLDSVLVKPAETLRKVPAQADGEDVHEDKQSEGVEQRHCVL